mmetsp:Transcript_58719/g.168639  ORF Transcript_58719/g.168639 Transcript_58719/m.168639 type:complete len:361 (+) Transcript_58719:1159-2241(+)
MHHHVDVPTGQNDDEVADGHDRQWHFDRACHKHSEDNSEQRGKQHDPLQETSPELGPHEDAKVAVRHKKVLYASLIGDLRAWKVRNFHDGWELDLRDVLAQELAERTPTIVHVVHEKPWPTLCNLVLAERRLHVNVVLAVAVTGDGLVQVHALQRMRAECRRPREAEDLAILVVGGHEEFLETTHRRTVAQWSSGQILAHQVFGVRDALPPLILVTDRQDHTGVGVQLADLLPKAECRHAHDHLAVVEDLPESSFVVGSALQHLVPVLVRGENVLLVVDVRISEIPKRAVQRLQARAHHAHDNDTRALFVLLSESVQQRRRRIPEKAARPGRAAGRGLVCLDGERAGLAEIARRLAPPRR